MVIRGKKDGVWYGGNDNTEGSVVYGKSGGSWLYAKEVWAKNGGTWKRAWTDCRQHDAGGRDWTASAGVIEYQGSCGNRQSRIRTDYTKTGCTSYSRYTSWISAPDCNSGCFTPSTSTVYSGSCGNRTAATRTTYTANAGSGCTTYFVDGPYTSSPDCNSTCFTASTATVYRNSCASRESTTRTTYTANAGSGCTSYSVDGTWVSSPACGAVGGSCWTNVTNNYIGQTVIWAGVSYDVYDVGGGNIWCSRTDATNQYCGGGYLELYTLWSCGGSQGVTYGCYPLF